MPSLTQKLDRLFADAPVLPFDEHSRIVIMSDCHRGQGNGTDNFLPNSSIFQGALEHYYRNGFTYIELGDGDELWENRCIRSIASTHSRVFELLQLFYEQNRLYMLYGNHDMIKRRRDFPGTGCKRYEGPYETDSAFLEKLPITEGLILENTQTAQQLLLTHGHQGSLINDDFWLLGRFLVRHLWKPLENIGLKAPSSGARSIRLVNRDEKALCAYASERNRVLIAGHTHHPVFSFPGSCPYFNDGSCVRPQLITALEIENNAISLVRWSVTTNPKSFLYISREVLNGPRRLTDYMIPETTDSRTE